MIYLISHFNSAGTGVGQFEIEADTEVEAREQFAIAMPERQFGSIAQKDS